MKSLQQRGASFLEFIIVAPILLLVAGGTVELARYIRFRQIADVLSKEAAMRAYRECDITQVEFTSRPPRVFNRQSEDDATDPKGTSFLIKNCLNTVNAAMEGTLNASGIQGGIILSMYRFDFANLVPTPGCSAANPTRIPAANPSSVYAPQAGGISGPNGIVTGTWGCTTGRVVISEVTFQYNPIINYRVIGVGNSFDVNFANYPLSTANQQNLPRETTIL